jgi:hypothetical protein
MKRKASSSAVLDRETKQVQRLKRFVGVPKCLGLKGERTFLELSSMGEPIRRDYANRFAAVVSFARTHSLDMNSEQGWDLLLCEWSDVRFFQGDPADDGTKDFAAVKFHVPWVDRLPRTQRPLKGWLKRAPRRTRPPLPWEALL